MRIAIAVALLGVAACSEPAAEQPAPETVSIEATVGTINTIDAGRAANEILDDAPEAGTIRIAFASDGVDRLGNPKPIPLFVLSFDGDDVAAANFDNLDPWATLNLATDVEITSGEGRRLILGDCDVHPVLCEQAKPPAPQ